MEELINIIGQVGFPIAISLYLLITRDKIIVANTTALNSLKEAINEKNLIDSLKK